ncbi:MAG TPA: DUF4783 domain-containing protein, partial [Flavobacteriales bacterium]|nr:DUF4783 domain-containing protein [Flavobacteriales bacterium]
NRMHVVTVESTGIKTMAVGLIIHGDQAEQILRRFFDENPPVGMVVEHQGQSKLGDQYYIGILRTRTGHFRVTFFLKRTGDQLQVKQLRIEAGRSDH